MVRYCSQGAILKKKKKGVCLVKTRIGFELESFATSSETTLGVSSCAKPSLPWGRKDRLVRACKPRAHVVGPEEGARVLWRVLRQTVLFLGILVRGDDPLNWTTGHFDRNNPVLERNDPISDLGNPGSRRRPVIAVVLRLFLYASPVRQ